MFIIKTAIIPERFNSVTKPSETQLHPLLSSITFPKLKFKLNEPNNSSDFTLGS